MREAEFFMTELRERRALTSARWCSTRCCPTGSATTPRRGGHPAGPRPRRGGRRPRGAAEGAELGAAPTRWRGCCGRSARASSTTGSWPPASASRPPSSARHAERGRGGARTSTTTSPTWAGCWPSVSASGSHQESHGQPRGARSLHHPPRPARDRPPPAPGGDVGPARRPLLRRPDAVRAAADHDADGTRAQGPVEERPLVVLGQIRPTTSQTLFRSDWVGRIVPADERPFVARCLAAGEIMEGEVTGDVRHEPVRELCIPVTFRGRTIGVLTKESTPTVGRQPGELERTYVEVFNRFARMIASGEFPFAGELGPSEEAPRVGDGVILLDGAMRVAYASPNGVSALHRVGVHANSEGMRLGELGLPETAMRTAYTQARPATEEIERGPEITVLHAVHPPARAGRGDRRAGAAARHLRAAPPRPAAALEGRHHPRDPPPGEEQPADHLVAAAAPGPAAGRRPRPRPPSRSRCGASGRSPWCTRRCRTRPATTCPSSRSCGRWCGWWRRA